MYSRALQEGVNLSLEKYYGVIQVLLCMYTFIYNLRSYIIYICMYTFIYNILSFSKGANAPSAL